MYVGCGIEIDKSIVYKFVTFSHQDPDTRLLGTFHEWNNTYYINILVDLYNTSDLEKIVIHETRHMIVQHLKNKEIIDLVKYTEEIATEKNAYYTDMFNSGVYLLREEQCDG